MTQPALSHTEIPLSVKFRLYSLGIEPQQGNVAQPKQDKKKKKQRSQAAARNPPIVATPNDAQFGDLQIVQSSYTTERKFTKMSELNASKKGEKVWVRARIHTNRGKGNSCFILLRQQLHTAQAILFKSEECPKDMIKYASKIPKESIVDILGEVNVPDRKVESATQSDIELAVKKIFAVSVSEPELPFQLDDAGQPCEDDMNEEQTAALQAEAEKIKASGKPERATVGRDIRLDNREVDMRIPAQHGIFRVQSGVGTFFRSYLLQHGFTEIHSPKLISAASEGGADVFKLNYFGSDAFLAQSPQLYKQMALTGDMGRVFEIGPVFRSEKSNTPRHLCEFTGLDFEMEISEHYHEVLRMIWGLFVHIFDQLNAHFKTEIDTVRHMYPFEDLKYGTEPTIIHFEEATNMLKEVNARLVKEGKSEKEIFEYGARIETEKGGDFNTPNEKLLGKLMRAKYGVDFYIIDKYPLAARPFYTMPCPNDNTWSNSYDVFLRGEEITSGAQRIHDYKLLIERATSHGIPLDTLKGYTECFRYGAAPHGGGGIGLERVVMLFLGLKNIRLASMFPRDPRRCTP